MHSVGTRNLKKLQSEKQKKIQEKIKLEEWKLLLAGVNLQSDHLPNFRATEQG